MARTIDRKLPVDFKAGLLNKTVPFEEFLFYIKNHFNVSRTFVDDEPTQFTYTEDSISIIAQFTFNKDADDNLTSIVIVYTMGANTLWTRTTNFVDDLPTTTDVVRG